MRPTVPIDHPEKNDAISAGGTAKGVLLLLAVVAISVTGSRVTTLAQTCDPQVNPVVCENQLPGNSSSEWDVGGAGDSGLQGFATDISVNKGETVHFKVDTLASTFTIDIYRLGYYAGAGARRVATIANVTGRNQPDCLTDGATGLIDCGNWSESASWAVPLTAVSGIYIAKLSRSGGGASHIPFIVRDDSAHADILFQTSDTTWEAYNSWGGNSLYEGGPGTNPGRAYKVSYNRPFNTRANSPEDWLFNAEYPMVRWLEANGYNVSYSTGVDTDRYGATDLSRHQIFLSVGHDEYWSGAQRANVEAARAVGVNLGFFSGNEIFWKTRWESSIDGTGTPYRTLVSYKETHANAQIDPKDPPTWTGTWRDPRFSPPADGGRPENALSGTMFTVNCCSTNAELTRAIKVPQTYANQPFWRNTRVATQPVGGTVTLAAGTLGYEWDENLNNGFRPAGLTALSSATYSVPSKLQDYGSTFAAGTATHQLTLYRHASGALVFGAGTAQWSWGLDGHHDRGSSTPDLAMQQATVNLFADMGMDPGSLQPGLVPGRGTSGDTLAPTSTITSPAPGATLPGGTPVTITGTANDAGGGHVASVSVSTDGGVTWQVASGTTSWSYQWTPGVPGTVTLKSRATDDSLNLETPSAGVTVTVSPKVCPCSLWSLSTTPGPMDSEAAALELGVKFTADTAGTVSRLRFYKYAQNTGAHVANLWTSTGTLLATVPFTNETASGWQEAIFTTPVAIAANTTYVASYHTMTGFYAATVSGFATAVDNAPLHALATGAVAGGNGVYASGATSVFPTQPWNASNYWVDVVFNTGAPPPPVVVPNVVNLTQAAATTAITNAGLIVGTVSTTSSATVPAGSVISESPAAGTQVAANSSVNLVVSTGPAPAGIAVETTVFSEGSGARTTPAFNTTAAGDVLVAFAASDGPSTGAQTLTVSGAGLTWTLVQRANTRAGTAEIWKATATAALTNATVTSTQARTGYRQSLTVVAFKGASATGASAPANGASGAPSVTLVTTKAASVVYGVGNDWDRAVARTLGANQTLVHQFVDTTSGDTYWVQARTGAIATANTSVQLNDTAPTNDRWNFASVEVVP